MTKNMQLVDSKIQVVQMELDCKVSPHFIPKEKA